MRYETPPRKPYTRKNKMSSIIKLSKGPGHYVNKSILGREAELRVRNLLAKLYDFPVYVGSGTNGEPDVVVLSHPPIHVEVKTCELIKKCGSIGTAKGFRHSWMRLSERARGRRMERVYFIEWRHKGEYLYTWLDGSVIDELLDKKPGIEVFHVPFKMALVKGQIISDKMMSPEPLQTSQKSMGDYLD